MPGVKKWFYYRPQRSCGQGNVFTGVCLSTGGGGEGVCLSACWDAIPLLPGPGNPPPDQADTPPGTRQTPPWDLADTPPRDQADTPPGSRLQHTVYERPVRILLECILVIIIFIAQIISGERLGVTLILDDPAGNSYMQVGVQRITCLPSVLRVLILAC